ncbi:hypothetical protein [Anaeromyxobacter diazotrophicus]|uniref:Uncharacterized protein n=1 Tax=Anaeromyxobacter diazotrophicus TaxID=2590199 RepID=A0A7I9VPP7_9BACT|nr:hypothetical protein [Anaeromyxobacter diazotrophicus]GEJ58382.1 hypothetical protein AMYX_31230 [Anaeromyxobacter diazotrophicus]
MPTYPAAVRRAAAAPLLAAAGLALAASPAFAQGSPPAPAPARAPQAVPLVPPSASPAAGAASGPQNAILLTIFLRHDQSKPLPEINAQLDRSGFHERFPPPGVEVVSWYVMMGIGQVVTLRVPPDKLREVNLAVENGAWGAFRTEFYPTYDYRPVWEQQRAQRRR